MKLLLIAALLLIGCLADNFSDNPAVNKAGQPEARRTPSIYEEINNAVKGEPTDQNIQNAVIEVCKKRNITDTARIKEILSDYYL